MTQYDVKPTVEKIKQMAETIRKYADEIENHGNVMLRTGDLTYAAEVVSAFTAMMINARLDLMVVRPLRETMKEVK